MAKITIVRTSLSYKWEPMDLNPEKIGRHAYMINDNCTDDQGNLLLLTDSARREIFEFIQWKNMETIENRNEQGGLMAGKHYSIPGSEKKICVVKHVFPLHRAQSSAGYLDASAEDWHKAYHAMDKLLDQNGERLEAIGWFHTHPNDLAVFMSGTDRYTQSRVFSGEYSYAMVLNPHTGRWKAFRSKDVLDAQCVMLDTDELALLCGAEEAVVQEEAAVQEAVIEMKKARRRPRWRNIEKAKQWMKRKAR